MAKEMRDDHKHQEEERGSHREEVRGIRNADNNECSAMIQYHLACEYQINIRSAADRKKQGMEQNEVNIYILCSTQQAHRYFTRESQLLHS